jgi:multifunctional methyltransferase subunit TRM112
MVRLITHNLLACHVKGCTSNNFPLQLKDVQIELREAEFNPDFLKTFIPKLEWTALVDTAKQVRIAIISYHILELIILGLGWRHIFAIRAT